MKKYIFYYEDCPLGAIEFDEVKGVGRFVYNYTSSIPQLVPIKPATVITLLEDIRYDAMDIKTVGEFERYVATKYGNFHYKAMKGFE